MRTVWTDDLIKQKILEVAYTFDPIRMPSKSEIENYYGNAALTNKLSKTGGFYKWADKLGLEPKESDTKLGMFVENYVCDVLESKGFTADPTPLKYPYDILLNNCVKIDVKSAHKSYANDSLCYMYRINKKQPTCDFYVLCEVNDSEIESVYVIPSVAIAGQTMIGMGTLKTKYAVYNNRFDLLEKAIQFYKSLSV